MGLVVVASLWAAAPSARAQSTGEWHERGGGDLAAPDAEPPIVTGSGAYTLDSTPRSFGGPRPGTIRLSPRWDTYVYTGSSRTSGAGGVTLTGWTNVLSLDVDQGDVVVRAFVPLAYFNLSLPGGGGPIGAPMGGGVPRSIDQAELGNVELEVLANIDLGSPEQRLLIGGGVALPTATDQVCEMAGCGTLGVVARNLAWSTSFRNAAAWAEHSFTLWPSLEYRLGVPWFLFSAIGTVPVFIPTNSHIGGPLPLARGNVEVMLALDVSGAVRLANVVDVGVSFLAWALPSGAGYTRGGVGPDLGQTALSFFVRTDPELDTPVTGGAEFIVDLDNTWGPTGDPGKYWGLRVFIGGRVDV